MTEYGYGTRLELEPGPFACAFVRGRAMCSDGVVRAVRFPGGGIADTFFSVPAAVDVRGRRVSGFVTVETAEGSSTETEGDPAVVKFHAYTYRRNADVLPAGTWKREALEVA